MDTQDRTDEQTDERDWISRHSVWVGSPPWISEKFGSPPLISPTSISKIWFPPFRDQNFAPIFACKNADFA